MALRFTFPKTLRSLENEHEDDDGGHLFARNPIDVASLSPSQLEELVKGVAFDLSDKELFCIEEQDVFDRVYSLVSNFSSLAPSYKLIIVETLRSNLTVLLPSVDLLSRAGDDGPTLIDRIASHRNAFKIYSFFLFHTVLLEESSASSSINNSKATTTSRKKQVVHSWNWEPQRVRILNVIANSLEINLSLLFGSSDPDENYLSFIVKNALSMYENSTLLKNLETKEALGRIVGACATKYHYTAQSSASMMHLIHKHDFVVIPMAEAVAWAEKKYSDGTLACSLIREIGRTNPKAYVKDTAGAENVGCLLVELADRLPHLVSTNIGVVVPHFGGESFKIRNALVGVLGKLVVKAFKDLEGEVSSKSVRLRTKQAMLEILLERCRDVSAYTRSKTLHVWGELCQEHSISIGLWNEVAVVATGRLEDKSSIVRKAALSLLIMMLQHNPFGPQLQVGLFEATLEQYRKKLNELEPDENAESVVDDLPSDDSISGRAAEVEHVTAEGRSCEQQESLSDSMAQGEEAVGISQEISVPDIGNLEQTRALVASLEAGLKFSKSITAAMPTLVQLMASSSATDVENTILLLMRCKQFQISGAEACLRKMLPLITALWDHFCFNISGTTAEQCRGALSVLCMAAISCNGILGSHLQDIIDIGFGRWAKVDPLLARTACVAIHRLSEEDRKKMLANNGSRVFSLLGSLVTGFWLPDSTWYSAADKAISAVYATHPTPETFAVDLVKKSLLSVFQKGKEDDLRNEAEDGPTAALTEVQVAKLSRFLFIASHVAMNHMLYIESCIRKVQKQKTSKEMASETQKDDTTGALKDDNINDELGVSASEDAIIDSLSERSEKEIVSGGSIDKNLIGFCAPFLSKLCRNFTLMQKYPELQASGMLALCRFMIIDADFCESNLQLLFTVVENAPSETVRSNCTVSLGDLAVRFPNLLEPWTENMYFRLRDPSVSVRKNAVLVLSHLILNDMMKVKGYINEMAVCLEDEEERISSLAKLFFNELSKKGANPIYNLLPDILGKLSHQNLKKESFCNIMQFLIGSIKKDKQMEALVEKLCNRFSGVTDLKQWEYIAYCLAQLTFTEKGMKKLIEAFKTYEHVLSEDSVMEHFKTIVNKGKKFVKPEMKGCIEEFEEKLTKFHLEKKEQEATARNAQIHQEKLIRRAGFVASSNNGDESGESVISEEDDRAEPAMDDTAKTPEDDRAEPAMDDTAKSPEDDRAEPAMDDTAKSPEDDRAEPAMDERAKSPEDDRAEPATDDAAEPTVADAAEPVMDDSAVPAVDDAAEPAMDATVEPAVDATVEPAVDAAVEPAVDDPSNLKSNATVEDSGPSSQVTAVESELDGDEVQSIKSPPKSRRTRNSNVKDQATILNTSTRRRTRAQLRSS
ncbi:Condensin-1 complex subunit CAP-D2 [Linum grandiflorum]